ncbi:hypothetical protein V7S76_01290 [Aquirufa sp. ROCK2-A2]
MKKLRIAGVSIMMMVAGAFGVFAQSSSVSDYAGTYQLQENPYVKSVKLTVNAGKLVMAAEGFPDAELAAGKQVDEFVLESMNAVVSFSREAGKVKSIKIEAQGQELKGDLVASKAGLDQYVGSFKMAENEYVKKLMVSVKEGKLVLTSDANPAEGSELSTSNESDTFSANIQGYSADIIFSRNSGKVATIKVSVGGGAVVLTGERE